eukprot:COSAG01_NODE_49421_length_372_cov_0.948718_1_plen_24_part_01
MYVRARARVGLVVVDEGHQRVWQA